MTADLDSYCSGNISNTLMQAGLYVRKSTSLVVFWVKTACILLGNAENALAGVAKDWTTGRSGFDPWQGQRIFPLACVQTGSGAHPASCTMGTGGPFPAGEARPGRDADHSPPSRCRDHERVGAIPPLPPKASTACSGTALLFNPEDGRDILLRNAGNHPHD
jgi:hypothetical protein